MINEQHLLKLINNIQNTALNFFDWKDIQDDICQTVKAKTSMLAVFDNNSKLPIIYSTVNIDLNDWSQYEKHYYQHDLWYNAGQNLSMGDVFIGNELIEDDVFYNGEFYNDFLRPIGLHQLLAANVYKDNQYTGYLSCHTTSDSANAFNVDDKAILKILTPHLINALQVSLKLQQLESNLNASWQMYDLLPVGIFLLDKNTCVLRMNHKAEELISLNDGLRLENLQLCASLHSCNTALQKLFRTATSNTESMQKMGGQINLPRPSMGRPWHIQTLPVTLMGANEYLADIPYTTEIFVIVTASDSKPLLPADFLIQHFHLTPAESKLAICLCQHGNLKSVAEQLAISIHTARNHLKHIYQKTGTRRQAELVQLLMSYSHTHNT